jgi:hypothetical protein
MTAMGVSVHLCQNTNISKPRHKRDFVDGRGAHLREVEIMAAGWRSCSVEALKLMATR